MQLAEFQKAFKTKDCFNKLIFERPTKKQIDFIKKLCEALGEEYRRPTSLITASKRIEKLVSEAKYRLQAELVFANVVHDRMEDLAHEEEWDD